MDIYNICVGRNCEIAGKFALRNEYKVVKRITEREKVMQNWKKFQDKK